MRLPGKIWLYIALCVLSITARTAYVVYDQSYRVTHGAEMERAAANLAREGTLANVYSETSGKSAHVSPLYPLLLAGLYRIFGWNTVAGRIAQEFCAIIATTIGFALLPWIARRAKLSVTAGWAAAFTLALLPVNLWIETSGAWEQPYSALALLGLFAVFCKLRDEEWRNRFTVAKAGLLLGIISLLSPSILPAGVLMALAEILKQPKQRKQVILSTLLMIGIACIMLAPWILRNYYVLGGFIPFRSNLGLELAIGNNSKSNGKTFLNFFGERYSMEIFKHPLFDSKELEKLEKIGEWPYMQKKKMAAFAWIKQNPIKIIKLTAQRFRFYWFPPFNLWAPSTKIIFLKSMIFNLFGFCALVTMGWLVIVKQDRAWLLAVTAIGPSLIYMITHIDPRYRYPIFGITALLTFQLALLIKSKLSKN